MTGTGDFSVVGAGTLDRSTYDQLKQQVQQLKLDQKWLQETKAEQRKVETAALLQQRIQYEDQLHTQQQEVAALQQRLKDSIDRATKVRQHSEKEKKALAQQLDKVQDVIAQLEQKHVEDLAARDLAHKQQLQDIRDLLEQRQREWAQEKQQLQEKQAAFMTEVEEWSQGEVEALQNAAAERLRTEQQLVTHWQHQHQKVQDELEHANQHIISLQKELDAQQQEMSLVQRTAETQQKEADAAMQQQAAAAEVMKQQLQAMEREMSEQRRLWDQEKQQWQHQLQLQQQEQAVKETEVRTQHAVQLDAVHVKLQTVLAKKDATINALRSELEAALASMQQLEEEDGGS